MQDKKFWFGVTYTYVCPKCSEPNQELAAVSSNTDDPSKINPILNREMLVCRHCKNELAQGIQVLVNVQYGTLEQLRTAGYPVPVNSTDN